MVKFKRNMKWWKGGCDGKGVLWDGEGKGGDVGMS